MQKIKICSVDRETGGTSTDGRIKWDGVLDNRYQLLSFEMTNRLYNVNSQNNNLPLEIYDVIGVSTTTPDVTLTNGYYSPSSLATQLIADILTETGLTFVITYNSSTGKLSFTPPANYTFRVRYDLNAVSSSHKLLGFDLVAYPSGVSSLFTSLNCIDINPIKNIYMNIIDDNEHNIETYSWPRFSLVIKSNAGWGEVIRYSEADYFKQFITFDNVKNIRYLFVDGVNNELDFNGIEWEMLLVKK